MSYTPRQMGAFSFLAGKRMLREQESKFYLDRFTQNADKDAVKKQQKTWAEND